MEPEEIENIPEPGTPRPAPPQRPWLVTKRKGSPPIVMGKPGNITARFAASSGTPESSVPATPAAPQPATIPVTPVPSSDIPDDLPAEVAAAPPAPPVETVTPGARPAESPPVLPFTSTARPFPVAPTAPLTPAATPARTFPESQATLFRSPARATPPEYSATATPSVAATPAPVQAPATAEATPAPAARPGPPASDETLATLRYIAGALEDMRGRLETLTREERYQQFSPLSLIGAGLEVVTLAFVIAALADWVFAAPLGALTTKLLFATVFQLAALTAFLLGRR